MHPELQNVASRRLGVFTAVEARRAGYQPEEISAAIRSGTWRPLRRGIYIESAHWAAVAADERMRHLIHSVAVLAALGPGPVLSHESAARVHRLVLPRRTGDTVRLTDAAQWRQGRGYRVARAALPEADVVHARAFASTSPARTLVDCAREWSLTDSVVAMDAAIQLERVTRAQLERAVLAASHRVGVGAAGRALSLADGRAESPLETRARLALLAEGLPLPELQVEIHDDRGFVGRVDAWYAEAAVAVELDGRIKYLEPRGGRTPAEVAWDEKRREDRLRELDIRVLRLVEEDIGRARRDLAPRLGRLLATPFVGPRRFRVVRTAEPGSTPAEAA
jgi:predicted transcriptional regulator of viral defense system